jgi:hypothetical protein
MRAIYLNFDREKRISRILRAKHAHAHSTIQLVATDFAGKTMQYLDDDEDIDDASGKSPHADENMDTKRAKKGGKAGVGGGKSKTNSRLAHLPEEDDVSAFTQSI